MKRMGTLAGMILLTASLALGGGGTKHMTIEDTLALKSVGGPLLSPDGKWIVYTVSEWNKEKNRRFSHIYLATTDGRRSFRLTNGEKGESSPQWSPDGKKISFLASRDEDNQIWTIPIDGGEAEKLTSEDNGVSAYDWAPNGERIAFVTRDTPEDKKDREKRKKDKFDAIVVEDDLIYSHLWVIDTDSKETKRLTKGVFTPTSPEWSPDSKWIAYATSQNAWQASSYKDISEDRNTDIYIVSAEGGTPKPLVTSPAAESSPKWSPDGNQIAFVATEDPKSWAAKRDVLVIPARGGTASILTKDFFESAGGGLTWARDGKILYFSTGIGVHNHIFQVPAAGGEVIQVTKGDKTFRGFDLAREGSLFATIITDPKLSGDIWISDLASGAERRITSINPQLEEFALAETEVLHWKGPDDFDIEGILVKPLDYVDGKLYPMILQIHGGPYGKYSATFDARAQFFAAKGYAILKTNPRGSTGYGNKFTVANVGDWGGKDYQDWMAGVATVINMGVADPEKLVVMGGSYGGFSTFWTVTQTDRFKAAIGHAGISDWYSFHGQSDIPALMEYGFLGYPWESTEVYRKYSPMTYVKNVKTPLMITHGEQDRRVPIAQAEEYYRALKKRGVDVVFVRYPREGHGIREPNHVIDLMNRQLKWFDSHLGIKRPQKATTESN